MRRFLLALAAGFVVALVSAAGASAYPQTWVPYPQLLAQARSGPLIRAIINPQRKDVEIKFANLNEWHAYYPAGAQAGLQRLFDARHIRLLFVARHRHVAAAKPAAVHHHLRYIVGGVLVALVVAGVGFALWRRRAVAAGPAVR